MSDLQARFDALRERTSRVAPHLEEGQYTRCNYVLAELKKPIPRTCAECGLGPCKAWRAYTGVTTPRLPSTAELESKG